MYSLSVFTMYIFCVLWKGARGERKEGELAAQFLFFSLLGVCSNRWSWGYASSCGGSGEWIGREEEGAIRDISMGRTKENKEWTEVNICHFMIFGLIAISKNRRDRGKKKAKEKKEPNKYVSL
jgi:hypothetical protein